MLFGFYSLAVSSDYALKKPRNNMRTCTFYPLIPMLIATIIVTKSSVNTKIYKLVEQVWK